MSVKLPFDFIVDKTKNTVFINKDFAADLPLVWDAFTKKEILDKWWAPKPYASETKVMDFTVGGRRFYAMVSPEGQKHWSLLEFTSISPKTNFKFSSVFADDKENINEAVPPSYWDVSFSERNGTTTVSIVIKLETLAALEQKIEMGFKEGFTMTLTYLEQLLKELQPA